MLKPSRTKNVVFIVIGILAGLSLIYVVYVLFIKNPGNAESLFAGSEKKSQKEVKMVTIPFKAEFTLHYVTSYEDVNQCGELPWMRIIVEGSGTEPTLGKFTVYSEFCVQTGTGVYLDSNPWFVTAEGDSLFFAIGSGQIIAPDENDPPYYVNKWDDPFEFAGGSGRFEGATGEGMKHSYNSTEDDVSHHTWEGSLTMREE